MKSNRFIAVSLLFACMLTALDKAQACIPSYYTASDKFFYRIMPYWQEESDLPQVNLRKENCVLWQKQAKGSSINDIEEALYNLPLKKWQELDHYVKHPDGKKPAIGERNTFLKQLLKSHNHDAIRLLYWAKCFEDLRKKQTSPWHYSCSNEDALTLNALADSAIGHIHGQYAMRYLFLAVKCLYTLHSDLECLRLWQKHSPCLGKDCIYNASEGYVAGCMYRLGMLDQATTIYVRQGDMESLATMRRPMGDMLKAVYKSNPNSPYLPMMLQRILRVINHDNYQEIDSESNACFIKIHDGTAYDENDISSPIFFSDGSSYDRRTINDNPDPYFAQDYSDYHSTIWFSLNVKDLRNLLTLCKNASRNPAVRDKGLWCYTAAALLEYFKRPQEAIRYIDHPNATSNDPFIRRSLQFMRFYLHSRYDPIDSNYIQMIHANIQKMDGYIKSDYLSLSQPEQKKLKEIYTNCYRYGLCSTPDVTIYSNDALQYILFSKERSVCRRLVHHGYEILALQIANLGSTRLENLLFGQPQNLFGSDLFMLADGLCADTLQAYYRRISQSTNDNERFLNRRGWSNHDYWHELIGTHFLREQRFPLAAKYLGACSEAYDTCLYVQEYLIYDPFKIEETAMPHHCCKRYHFAQEMAQLEQQMRTAKDPNIRAESQLRYSIGLKNAAYRDWALFSYAFGEYPDEYSEELIDWSSSVRRTKHSYPYLNNYWGGSIYTCTQNTAPYRGKAYRRAVTLQKQALRMYTDPEAKARGYAMLWMISRVMKELPNTQQGQYYARHCDQWRDYLRPAPPLPTPFRKVKHV